MTPLPTGFPRVGTATVPDRPGQTVQYEARCPTCPRTVTWTAHANRRPDGHHTDGGNCVRCHSQWRPA